MPHVIRFTLKILGNISEIFLHNDFISHAKQHLIQIILALRNHLSCPENSTHIRHYVDPVTGRAIPTHDFKV